MVTDKKENVIEAERILKEITELLNEYLLSLKQHNELRYFVFPEFSS